MLFLNSINDRTNSCIQPGLLRQIGNAEIRLCLQPLHTTPQVKGKWSVRWQLHPKCKGGRPFHPGHKFLMLKVNQKLYSTSQLLQGLGTKARRFLHGYELLHPFQGFVLFWIGSFLTGRTSVKDVGSCRVYTPPGHSCLSD